MLSYLCFVDLRQSWVRRGAARWSEDDSTINMVSSLIESMLKLLPLYTTVLWCWLLFLGSFGVNQEIKSAEMSSGFLIGPAFVLVDRVGGNVSFPSGVVSIKALLINKTKKDGIPVLTGCFSAWFLDVQNTLNNRNHCCVCVRFTFSLWFCC